MSIKAEETSQMFSKLYQATAPFKNLCFKAVKVKTKIPFAGNAS